MIWQIENEQGEVIAKKDDGDETRNAG